MKKRLLMPVLLSGACAAGPLAGCSADPTQHVSEEVGSMGNAEPAESPEATNPAGEVIDFEAIDDIAVTEGAIGVRAGDAFFLGDLEGYREGDLHETASGTAAGITAAVNANAGAFAIVRADQNEVELIDSANPGADSRVIAVNEQVTVAAPLAGGGLIAGSDATQRVWVYDAEGNEADTFAVARPSDFILAQTQPDGSERAVRVNRFDTTIQDLQLDRGRQGGTLRIGLGVGKVAFGENGIVLAADATGNSLLVYTTDEVVRLHQMAPTKPGPWAVAWDPTRELAWVTSTQTNTVTGYDISQGVPLERISLDTVADARSLAVLDDGTLLIGSATGGGLQIISPDQVEE